MILEDSGFLGEFTWIGVRELVCTMIDLDTIRTRKGLHFYHLPKTTYERFLSPVK